MSVEKRISRRQILRKAAALGAGLAFAGPILAACGPTPTPKVVEKVVEREITKIVAGTPVTVKETVIVEKPKEVIKEVTVVPEKKLKGKVTTWQAASCYFCGAADLWNRMYPETPVEIVKTRDPVKWEAALRSGSGDADFIQSDPGPIQRRMLHNQLYDWTTWMDPSMRDGFIPFKLQECTHPTKNRIYGIPFQVGVVGIYYREDILKKVGFTNDVMQNLSWEGYLELGRKLKKDLGLALEHSSIDDTWFFTRLLWLAGGSYMGKDGTKVTLDSDIAKEAMAKVKLMHDEGLMSLELGKRSKTWWSACAEGKIPLGWDASWTNGYFELNLEKPEQGQGQWRNAPLPYLVKGGPRAVNWGGSPMETAAYTKNPDLCWAVQKFALATVEGAMASMRLGTVLCWMPALQTKEFKTTPFKFAGDWHINEIWARYANDIPLTYYMAPGHDETDTIFRDWYAKILKKEVSIDEGLKKAADEARKANEKWVRIIEKE